MNKNLDALGETVKIIPDLILKLTIKDIAPELVVKLLKNELDLEEPRAKEIALEIKERILKPISEILKRVGVEVEKIGSEPSTQNHPQPAILIPRRFSESLTVDRSPKAEQPASSMKPPQTFKVPNIGQMPLKDMESKRVDYGQQKTNLNPQP